MADAVYVLIISKGCGCYDLRAPFWVALTAEVTAVSAPVDYVSCYEV